MLTTSSELETSFLKPIYREIFRRYKEKKCITIFDLMYYYNNNLQKDMVFGRHQDAHESLGYILDDADDKIHFEIQIDQTSTYPNSVSKTSYKENILLVPLKKSIQESIDSYFESEDGSEYEENGKIVYSPKIDKQPSNTPDYLFVTLLRMKCEFMNGSFRQFKIKDEIEVSSHINYGGKKYRPISYIIHQGETQSGHYNAMKILNGKWTFFDDDRFTVVEDQYKALQTQSLAYIFLYQRDDSIIDSPTYYRPVIPQISMLNLPINNRVDQIFDLDTIDHSNSEEIPKRMWITGEDIQDVLSSDYRDYSYNGYSGTNVFDSDNDCNGYKGRFTFDKLSEKEQLELIDELSFESNFKITPEICSVVFNGGSVYTIEPIYFSQEKLDDFLNYCREYIHNDFTITNWYASTDKQREEYSGILYHNGFVNPKHSLVNNLIEDIDVYDRNQSSEYFNFESDYI